MKIYYKSIGTTSITDCPNGTKGFSEIQVGSILCQCCKYNRFTTNEYVDCIKSDKTEKPDKQQMNGLVLSRGIND